MEIEQGDDDAELGGVRERSLHDLGELLEDFGLCMLMHVDTRGHLRSCPMTPLRMDTDGCIWFFVARDAEVAQAASNLGLSFVDTDRGVYVSLAGWAELTQDRERIAELWTPLAAPWFPQGPDTPDLMAMRFVPVAGEYWDAPHSKAVRLAAMAVSVAARRPVGLGEHEKLDELGEDGAHDGPGRP